MVKVISLWGCLFSASTSSAHTQPTQASRMDMPITAVTYSSTSPAVRPADRRFFFGRRVWGLRSPEEARSSSRWLEGWEPPLRPPWEECRLLRRSCS